MMADAPQNLTPETATPVEAGDLFGHKGLSVGSDVPSLFTYEPLADAAAPLPDVPAFGGDPLADLIAPPVAGPPPAFLDPSAPVAGDSLPAPTVEVPMIGDTPVTVTDPTPALATAPTSGAPLRPDEVTVDVIVEPFLDQTKDDLNLVKNVVNAYVLSTDLQTVVLAEAIPDGSSPTPVKAEAVEKVGDVSKAVPNALDELMKVVLDAPPAPSGSNVPLVGGPDGYDAAKATNADVAASVKTDEMDAWKASSKAVDFSALPVASDDLASHHMAAYAVPPELMIGSLNETATTADIINIYATSTSI